MLSWLKKWKQKNVAFTSAFGLSHDLRKMGSGQRHWYNYAKFNSLWPCSFKKTHWKQTPRKHQCHGFYHSASVIGFYFCPVHFYLSSITMTLKLHFWTSIPILSPLNAGMLQKFMCMILYLYATNSNCTCKNLLWKHSFELWPWSKLSLSNW